jgi:hypothetical protein
MLLAIADLHSLFVVQPFTALYLPCYRIPVAFGGQSLCGGCKGLLFIAFPPEKRAMGQQKGCHGIA